ncbi:MAG TPA: PEP-CTERM sorting domain-containing protein [Verrucomicrobiae bacterium]|nr:PEP-CTERM sorting domain-containing protein [Verrucomicrobiae bacterium]
MKHLLSFSLCGFSRGAGVAPRALAITAVIFASIHGAWADTYTIDETATASFGTIDQNSVPPGNGAMSCVPTATMNSFIWLQNAYPSIFGNDLGGFPVLQGGQGSWQAAAALLASTNYMNTSAINGTTMAGWIGGKVAYLNAFSPVSMVFTGMDTMSVARPAWDQNANPTVNFLLGQLQDGEDVELGIWPIDKTIGHALTLTGLTWNDTDNSHTFTAPDTLTLDTIDPEQPGVDTVLTLEPGNAGNPMTVSNTDPNYANYGVYVALAESIPEPATWSLVALAVSTLIISRRRRGRAS